ncbi:hypothetical protein [Streptosporangium sp. NPDC006007]|uniref:hypothetical protein n=1 Tax=Streptosporangium sp. NPDC006007 TaxID=3154575 RepID=UPI0033B5EF39
MTADGYSREFWERSPEAREHPLADHLTVTRAAHTELPGYNVLIKACANILVDTSGPHVVAHFEGGYHDFTVDILNEPRCPTLVAAETPEGVREGYERSFRQLILSADRLDRKLAVLQTGELMRTVLETEQGTVYSGRIRPGQYVTGSVAAVPNAQVMDERLSGLVTAVRTQLYGLPDEQPGGSPVRTPAEPSKVTVFSRNGTALNGERLEMVKAACDGHLHEDDLQYLAAFSGWKFAYSADLFGAERLSNWFNGMSQDQRRDHYERLGPELGPELAQLRRSIRRLVGGELRRFVLDVQAGAVYVHPTGRSGDFLLGVTMNQAAVLNAENRMRDALDMIRRGFNPLDTDNCHE